MTWSILARDEITGDLAVTATSSAFAVGSRVPFIAGNVGAIATQGLANPYFGIDGVRLLREGVSPSHVLKTLKSRDAGRAHRQVHIMDGLGSLAAHTGKSCLPWAGHKFGAGVSVAGNAVAGPEVIKATLAAYLSNLDAPFAVRLISAMKAGEHAGGDRRAQRSAVLIIADSNEWSALDLRIDDHPNPLGELDRLERISRQEWVLYRRFVPTRSDPAGTTDHDVINAALGGGIHEV